MSRNQSLTRAAFTLLELVVVLSILALVTALAVRALDGVEDQRRYEANMQIMQSIEEAVLGSPDDRAADGTRTVSGFVADMGRLPKSIGDGEQTLAELWRKPDSAVDYDVRRSALDTDVTVPSGWRGPYLRPPSGNNPLLDGWGNPMTSLDPTGYGRLRDGSGQAITEPDQEIHAMRHLGRNGTEDENDSSVPLYDRDEERIFSAKVNARLTGRVYVRKDNGSLATIDADKSVTILVFGPDPADATQITVRGSVTKESAPTDPLLNPLPWTIEPTETGPTIGPRVVRAYLHLSDSAPINTLIRSEPTSVVLRTETNLVDLTITLPPANP